jgi:hypothetical protein
MIMLLRAIEAMYPGKRLIHLFVDNARCHHAKPNFPTSLENIVVKQGNRRPVLI